MKIWLACLTVFVVVTTCFQLALNNEIGKTLKAVTDFNDTVLEILRPAAATPTPKPTPMRF